MKKHSLKLGTLVLSILFQVQFPGYTSAQEYEFSAIPVGGGGYITGLMFHDSIPNRVYVRTDVGGMYGWDHTSSKWEQLLFSQAKYGHVDGFSLAPSNPNVIYVAGGDATKASDPYAILKTKDNGKTWQKLNFSSKIPFQGNQRDVRYTGERIQVDPANEEVVFAGTKEEGLFYSVDGGKSWNNHSDIPGNDKITIRLQGSSTYKTGFVGIRVIAFDPKSIENGRAQKVYAADYESGLYESNDAGATFQLMPKSPKTIRRLKVSSDGTLWATTQRSIDGKDGGKVYYFNGTKWINKTPEPQSWKPYNALEVHSSDPKKVIVILGSENAESPIYKSVDAGENWTKIHFSNKNLTRKIQPWKEAWQFATGPSAVEINPFAPNEVWITSGEAVYVSENFWDGGTMDNPVHFDTRVNGIEELVTFYMASPPSGEGKLFVGHADADGFRYTDLNATATDKFLGPNFMETTGIDYVYSNPDHLARVGGWSWGAKGTGSYSLDNGITWNEMKGFPTKNEGEYGLGNGVIAVSCNSIDQMVVVPIGTHPHYTTDRGVTWSPVGIDGDTSSLSGMMREIWQRDVPLQSDTKNPELFYLADRASGTFYQSRDGGRSFNSVSKFTPSKYREWVRVRPMPESKGEVWLGSRKAGLLRSMDAGVTWSRIDAVEEVMDFAFGKEKPSTVSKTLFVAGKINGEVGVFESNDLGNTFTRINGEMAFGNGLSVSTMTASLQQYGEVYIGTGGWGYLKGIKKK